ncbi:MAG: HpsJ family protein [Chloroflexota bacterium]
MSNFPDPNFLGPSFPKQKLPDTYGAKPLFLIIGVTCLASFVLDALALGLPPSPYSIEWRTTFLEKIGDRSILLLLGAALTMYGIMGNRKLVVKLAAACVIAGIFFHASCLVIIKDSLSLKEQALSNISNQATQLQTQLQESRTSTENAPTLTAQEIAQASQQIDNQAKSLQQRAQVDATKLSIVNAGNFVITGLGLIFLGRFGFTRR